MSFFFTLAMICFAIVSIVSTMAIPISPSHSSTPMPPTWNMQRATSFNAWLGAELKDKDAQSGANKKPLIVDVEIRSSKRRTAVRRTKKLPGFKTVPGPGMQCAVM
ncbi:hypothetical protein IQ06DRAFT_309835 [Phaeosphaeriaceae sp. SRC1lsM3a]|nr:hypothetical protein IQ06DRAFT_309835 [Stagonospora sp. SRC1lsM3a]